MNQRTKKQLNQLAVGLGWGELTEDRRRFEADGLRSACTTISFHCGQNTGGRDNFHFQINPSPHGQSIVFEAAIYAVRYRIYTGWHRFNLSESKVADLLVEFDAMFHIRWFESLAARRAYRSRFPQFTGFGWKEIRNAGPPPWVRRTS